MYERPHNFLPSVKLKQNIINLSQGGKEKKIYDFDINRVEARKKRILIKLVKQINLRIWHMIVNEAHYLQV